jgi:hypothetical protein
MEIVIRDKGEVVEFIKDGFKIAETKRIRNDWYITIQGVTRSWADLKAHAVDTISFELRHSYRLIGESVKFIQQ